MAVKGDGWAGEGWIGSLGLADANWHIGKGKTTRSGCIACAYVRAKSLQPCPTLCDAMDSSGSPARLLCPWHSPGKNTEVGCHAFLQQIFPTQGLNPCVTQGVCCDKPPWKRIREKNVCMYITESLCSLTVINTTL